MEFEFSHLLQPLSAPAAPPPRPTGPARRLEARPGTEATPSVATPPVDGPTVDPAAHQAPSDKTTSDWLSSLLAGSADPDDVGEPVTPALAPRLWTGVAEASEALAGEVADVAVLEPAAAPTPAPAPDLAGPTTVGDEASELPSEAPAPEPVRSRFATPSLDDDLLPPPRKRR